MFNDDLVLKMILDESGFSAGMNKAVKQLNSFDDEVKNTGDRGGRSLGNIWTSFVGNFLASGAMKMVSTGIGLITSSVTGAISRFDTLNNSTRVFANMGFGAKETEMAMEALKASINGLPTPLDAAIQGVQLIASSTNDLGKSEQIFSALNNGILGFGGTVEQVDNAIIQLSQSFSNGKVDAATWNSMINSGLGPSLNALAKQMGLTTGEFKEGLSSGEISVQQFQDALIKLNKEGGGGLKSLEQIAQDSTAGIGTGLQNMKTAVTRGVANVVSSIDQALKEADMGGIGAVIASIGSTFENALTTLADNIPAIIKFFKELNDTIEPFKPLIFGIVTAFTAMNVAESIAGKVMKLQASFQSLSGALGIVAAHPIIFAITAIASAVFYLWTTNEDFRKAVINIWEGIKQAFSDAATAVSKAWEGTKEFFSDLWSGIKETASTAVEGVKNAWSDTKQWFSNTWSDIKEGAKGLFDSAADSAKSGASKAKDSWGEAKQWFSNTWESIKDSASKTWSSISDVIMPFIEPLVNGIRNAFIHVSYFLEDLWTNLIEIGKNTFDILKNVILAPVLFVTSMITGGWEETRKNMLAVWENIKEAAGNIWTSIQTIFTSYITNIYMAAVNLWTGFKTSIVNLWNEVVLQAKMIWIEIKLFFENLWIDIKYKAIQMWIDLKYGVIQTWIDLKYNAIETWNKIKQFFADTWQNIKTGAADAWTNIKQTTVDVWSAIKQFFWDTVNNIVQSAQNAWENLKQGVSNAVNRVKEIFDSLKKINLFEIGKNIIQGLIDGISEKFNNLKKKVKSVASLVKDGITGALDINSPSRWMRDMVGKNIVLGIVEGINQSSGQLEKTMESLPNKTMEKPSVGKVAATSFDDLETQKNQKASTNTEVHLHLQVYGSMPESMINEMSKKMVVKIKTLMEREAAAIGG